MKLRTFRKICQGVFFALFVLLFLFTVYPFPEKLPVDIFIRLDPLVALIGMIAGRAFIATMLVSAVLLVLTLVFGRFFCGYVCPLGTLIDVSDFLLFRKHHKRENLNPKPNRNIKYFVLAGLVIASLLGADFLGFFSPMALAPRIFTLVLFPPLIWLANFLLDLLRPLFTFAGLDQLAQISFKRLFFAGTQATLVIFLFVVIANYWRRRFWCRYLCPTGAFLSLFSRYGIFKRKVTADLCDDCKRCMMSCDMRAVGSDPRETVLAECTLCGDCTASCERDSSRIGLTRPGHKGYPAGLNVSRRNFLYSTAGGLAVAASAKSGLNTLKNVNGKFIRPPGSLPENDFLARCIRCGECLKVCKTHGLQPALFEAGFDGLWSPHLVPRIGGCEEKCNMCGHVCPTQAVRALPLEEKRFVKIGTAVIDRSRCIAWEQNKLCLICDEICPTDAVEFRVVTTFTGPFKRPFILEDKCTGCGLCENKCPVAGRSAIEVFSIGEERQAHGSYITPEKKALRQVKESHETEYNADVIGSGGDAGGAPATPRTAPAPEKKADAAEEPLPGGFIVE